MIRGHPWLAGFATKAGLGREPDYAKLLVEKFTVYDSVSTVGIV